MGETVRAAARGGDGQAAARLGCVSYLNAKPLIDGIDDADVSPAPLPVRYDVPSALLADLESGAVDVALCPVIDYFRSAVPLVVVPAGCIGCDGPTLTVRLYSAAPIDRITTLHADTDSHTSVALVQVVLWLMHKLRPTMVDYAAREHTAGGKVERYPEAMLLIGDKVVTDSPPAVRYPHQLDLGEAWKELTGLPFVFAVWMAREGAALGDLTLQLSAARERNAGRVGAIVDKYAARHGWPRDLAHKYLGELLRYGVGPRQLEAIGRFGAEAAALGLAPGGATGPRPLRVYG